MADGVVNPKFNEIIEEASFSSEDPAWWGKYLQIFIVDISEPKKSYRQDVGDVFCLLVCSPAYAKNPNDYCDEEDLKRALIMDTYDEKQVLHYAQQKIDTIGKVSVDEAWERLGTTFDIMD